MMSFECCVASCALFDWQELAPAQYVKGSYDHHSARDVGHLRQGQAHDAGSVLGLTYPGLRWIIAALQVWTLPDAHSVPIIYRDHQERNVTKVCG